MAEAGPSPTTDIALAVALIAVDPAGLGGLVVRARTGPVRDDLLLHLRSLLPAAEPMRRLPLHAGDNRLLGGLDLAATLRAGRPIAERGLLAEADGGILVLAMAERLSAATVGRLAAVLDTGEAALQRDGFSGRFPARLGMVALDEGLDDEHPQPALLERLALHLDLDGLDRLVAAADGATILAARARLPTVTADDAIVSVLCATALTLGIGSLRVDLFALRVACAAAALAGRSRVTDVDAALAARLVLAPRATRLPVADPEDAETASESPNEAGPPETASIEAAPDTADGGENPQASPGQALGDTVLAAVRAALPPGLLAQLQVAAQSRARSTGSGQGALKPSANRGRPAGVRRGEPRGGARLSIIETLRAAAPWQRIRARPSEALRRERVLEIRPDDFRIARFKQRRETTTIFVVDASGSLALNRLAEAKGAVELLLADSYVRRDQVALLAFRGEAADLLLPPTRALVRAKRALAGLPGGGATPLAIAIDAAVLLGDQLRRRGQTPVIAFVTDGRANVARDGGRGRGRAEDDALASARAARATGIRTLVVDAGQRPQPPARRLAEAMGALYLPLPHADAAVLSAAVRAAGP